MSKSWTVEPEDILCASWMISESILGPRDGSDRRAKIERQIQKAMRQAFDETTRKGGSHASDE